MASLLKTQEANAANRKGKRKADDMDMDVPEEPVQKRNKQRVLLLSSRGVTHRMRHLMSDLEALLPHVKKGTCSIHLTSGVVFIDGCLQTRSWIRRISWDFSQNWPTSIIATTRCTSRHVGTKICTCG